MTTGICRPSIAYKQHYCIHVLTEKEETTDSKHKKDTQMSKR